MVVSIVPLAGTDGVTYCTSVPLTTSEADLGDGLLTPQPIATTFGAAIVAVVQLTVNGNITGNSTYVVMQIDLGDGVWIDLNWCVWTATTGSATFVFSNGVAGADTFQQSRNAGAVPNPQANGSNQMGLGGRIRFVGRTAMTGGSSSAPGVTTRVSATIKFKLLGLH